MTHIFVIEDNPTMRENIAFELEMAGYQITQATDGQDALRVLRNMDSLPDLIVSDIAMPEMDGYELLEAVRKHEQWNSIPFIFLTAFDSSNAIRLGKQLGVDDYLVKPFEPEDLILAIENKLKRHQEINAQAERKLDVKRRELINMIAHELRTPMTSIYGGIEMLEYGLKDVSDDTTLQLLELVDSGTKRLHNLINRVVLMVQLESGHLRQQFESNKQAMDLNQLMLKVLSDFDFPARNVSVQVMLSNDNKAVQGVPDYLRAALYELIDNAVKFSYPDATILVATSFKNDKAVITIQDEGVGILQADIERIWDYLIQIDRKVHEQQGVGLGLTIVRDVIESHGGKCEIDSIIKQGTKVIVTLPIADN